MRGLVVVGLVVVGLVVMAAAAWWAGRHTGFWFDPDEGCALQGRCEDPAELRRSWWLLGTGFAAVLAGVVLRWWTLPRTGTPTGTPTGMLTGSEGPAVMTRAAIRVAAAATIMGALTCLLTMIAFFGSSIHAGVLMVCLMWLGQAQLVSSSPSAAAGRPASVRRRWAVGVAASTAAVAAVAVALLLEWGRPTYWLQIALVWGVTVTAVVVCSWTGRRRGAAAG